MKRSILLLVVTIYISLFTALAQDTPLTNKYPGSLNSQDSLGRTADGPQASLNASISAGATSFTVTGTASAFPASGLSLRIDSETILCTTRSGGTFSGCLRGQKGTTATTHASGSIVRSPILSAQREVVIAGLLEVEKKLGVGSSPASAAATDDVLTKSADGTTTWKPGGGDFINVTAHAVIGNGSTDVRAALDTLVNTTLQVGGAGGDVYFPAGDYSIQSNMTFPANVRLVMDPRARLKPATGVVITDLTDHSSWDSSHKFTNALAGQGTISFSGNVSLKAVSPDWWATNTTPGTTDMGEAITASAVALGTMGKGTLQFSPSSYRIYTVGTPTAYLASFSGLTGISVLGNGTTLVIDPARVFTESIGVIFNFTNSKNIVVDGFNVTSPINGTDIRSSTVKGVEFTRFEQGCENIFVRAKIQGLIAGAVFAKLVGDPDSYRSKNITLVLDVTQSYYGFSCQFSGDNLVAHIKTDTVHRSYYNYGGSRHTVHVDSKDPYSWDCLISAAGGVPTENIELFYRSGIDTVNSSDGSNKIFLRFEDATPGILRNIKLHVNIKYAGSGETGAAPFRIEKWASQGPTVYDASDRGHILENVTISGYIEGTPHYSPEGIIYHSNLSTWGTGDFFRNIKLENLTINSTAVSTFFMKPFLNLTLENVRSNGNLRLFDDLTPSVAKVEVINSDFPNLNTWIDPDNQSVMIRKTSEAIAITAGWSGRTIVNTGAAATVINTLPAAVPGLEYTVVRTASFPFRFDPSGSDVIRGGGAGNYVSLDTDGATVSIKCFVAGTWEVVSTAVAVSDIQTQLDAKAPLASPVFTTQITTPVVIGGSGTTQSLTYRTTTGVGAAGADHIFQVGSNGATEAVRILNSGNVGIKTAAAPWPLTVRGTVSNNTVAFGTDDFVLGSAGTALLFGFGAPTGNTSSSIRSVFSGGTTPGILALNSTGGSVGIGTAAPLSTLSINGGLHVGGDSNAGDNNLLVDGNAQAATYSTVTNCADSAGAAACGSAAAGSVVIDAAATSVVISTTAITANSQISLTFDSSLGTRLGVTCNATPAQPTVTARTVGTSFTISVAAAPVTNPACFSFVVVN